MKLKIISAPLGSWAVLIALGLAFWGLLPAAYAQSRFAPAAMVPDGYRLIEEDILVPTSTDFGGFLPAAVFPSDPNSYWPGGIVPYEFDANVSADNRQAMLDAMAEWQNVANVQFIPRNGHADHVYILNSTGNSSSVGRQRGRQYINIYNWDWKFVMAHELAHALGYWHEQSASDRDNYIQVNYANIMSGKAYNFDLHSEARLYGPYDFDSLMHYDAYAFSANGQPTITVRPPNDTMWQSRIGQLDHSSRWDALVMGFIYSYSNDWFVDWSNSSTEFGSFFYPFRAFASAKASVPDWGYVWITRAGTYAAAGLHAKPMHIDAPAGGVILR